MINKPASFLPHGIYIVVVYTDNKQVIVINLHKDMQQFHKDSRDTSVSQGKMFQMERTVNAKA